MESVLLPMEPVEPRIANFFTKLIFSDNGAYPASPLYLIPCEFRKKGGVQQKTPVFDRGFVPALLQSATSAAVEILNSHLIAPTERILIGATIPARNPRMAVLITIVYIRTTVISEVFASSVDTVTEALALDVPIPRRRILPALLRARSVAISRRRWSLCNEASGDECQCRCRHNSQ
jgi:hypothetical protein